MMTSEFKPIMGRTNRKLPNVYVVEMGFWNLYARMVHQNVAPSFRTTGT
jgi:hypothetical protein